MMTNVTSKQISSNETGYDYIDFCFSALKYDWYIELGQSKFWYLEYWPFSKSKSNSYFDQSSVKNIN